MSFSFLAPKYQPVSLESLFDIFKGCKINRLDHSHKMPVMKTVSIVITNHTSVIALINTPIDVCQIITNHPTRFVFPNFTTQNAVPFFKGQ